MVPKIRETFAWAITDGLVRGPCPVDGEELRTMVDFKDWYLGFHGGPASLSIAESIVRNSDQELAELYAPFLMEKGCHE